MFYNAEILKGKHNNRVNVSIITVWDQDHSCYKLASFPLSSVYNSANLLSTDVSASCSLCLHPTIQNAAGNTHQTLQQWNAR